MPFARPTLTELREAAGNDLATAPGGDGAGALRFAITKPLAWAIANLAHGEYGYLDWIARQAVPFTAEGEYLEAWGALVRITRKPATPWSGVAQWAGAAGRVLPSGTALTGPGRLLYVTTAAATVNGAGTVSAPIAAVLAGSAGDMDTGDAVAITAGVSGIVARGTVTSSTVAGVDTELDDPFRTRILARWATPPQGGSAADYVEWALDVPGVTRAWVAPSLGGVGTVTVFTMWDDAEAAFGGFPQGTGGISALEPRSGTVATGDQRAVADYILPRQPVTALVYSVAPAAYPVDVRVLDLDNPSAATLAGIRAALADLFVRAAAPAGTTYPVTVPGVANGRIFTSAFQTAIAGVSGVTRFTLATPIATVQAPVGAIPTLGNVLFV